MKYYLISRDEIIKMWLKIINPSAVSALTKVDLCDLFERFARGKIQAEKILVSVHFSLNMIKLLEENGCENPEDKKEILMSALEEKIKNGDIDIELFNQMIKTECTFRIWSKNYNILEDD